jgi:hypothetical protein
VCDFLSGGGGIHIRPEFATLLELQRRLAVRCVEDAQNTGEV